MNTYSSAKEYQSLTFQRDLRVGYNHLRFLANPGQSLLIPKLVLKSNIERVNEYKEF